MIGTHIFIWFLKGNEQLKPKTKAILEDAHNAKFLSMASLWEMAIKISIGKLHLSKPLESFLPIEIPLFPIQKEHIFKIKSLQFHHKDPFDRLIIAQAIVENLTIVTDDRQFKNYDVALIEN